MNKISIDFIRGSLELEGYKLLSNEYINAHTKLDIECPVGHKIKLSWQRWKSGRRCKYCNKFIHIDDIRRSFEKEGYTLLSKEYRSSKEKLDFICSNGHIGNISWSHWKKGNRCKQCYIESIITPFNDIKKEIELENYLVLSNEKSYLDTKTILVKCDKDHEPYETTVNKWRSKNRCKVCSYEKKSVDNRLPYEYVKNSFEKNNYELLSEDYINALEPLEVICPNGHKIIVKWRDWHEGCRCSKCNVHFSKGEYDLSCFIENLGFDIIRNDRSIISPYELDIVIPEKKIAIEYCGLYWHSELMGKDKNYHLNKLDKCNKNGYRLITIFEDEWLYNKEVLKSKISYALGKFVGDCSIYARMCIIKNIGNKEKAEFLNKYHLQGNDVGNFLSLGAYFGDYLIGVITFAKPSISKGYRNIEKDIIELNRFCVHKDYIIPGLFSKMLTYFDRYFDYNKIFSFADLRWYVGDSYIKSGFKLLNRTKPNYWYVKNNKRIHRFNLRKPSGCKETEYKLRTSEGYYRVWDCGNLKFIRNKGEFYGS